MNIKAVLAMLWCAIVASLATASELQFPPTMSAEELLLAADEMRPERQEEKKSVLWSEHAKEGKSMDLVGEVRLISSRTRDGDIRRNLFAKQIYLEKPLGNGMSIFGIGYHDQEFRSLIAGVAMELNDKLQVGLGVGSSQYDGRTHTVINPWMYYHDDDSSGVLTVERYRHDSEDPWFVKGYYERKITDQFLLGLYGETSAGIGPMLVYRPYAGLKLWVSRPVWFRPHEGGVEFFLGATIEF